MKKCEKLKTNVIPNILWVAGAGINIHDLCMEDIEVNNDSV